MAVSLMTRPYAMNEEQNTDFEHKDDNDLSEERVPHDLIYLDHAATTPLCPEAYNAMKPYLERWYGNASAVYSLASKSRAAIEDARKRIAESLGAAPGEIIFTSGGSEADNQALIGVYDAYAFKGRHLITSCVEHHAVLRACSYLETRGASVTYLPVDHEGRVNPLAVEKAIRKDTILISVMAANNEVGTIQPIEEIAETAKKHGVLFHTDAVQAYGHIQMRMDRIPVDLLSASAHKMGGPKGIGFLYVRSGVRIGSLIHGGEQEKKRRAGTENTPAIAGFGAAAVRAFSQLAENAEKEKMLRETLKQAIVDEIPDVRILGDPEHRLNNHLSILIHGVDAEEVLIRLDLNGIAASSGAACSSGAYEPSHVLLAMGLDYIEAQSALRFTVSSDNTIEEMKYTAHVLSLIVNDLRKGA